jgi:hypothetical protein
MSSFGEIGGYFHVKCQLLGVSSCRGEGGFDCGTGEPHETNPIASTWKNASTFGS